LTVSTRTFVVLLLLANGVFLPAAQAQNFQRIAPQTPPALPPPSALPPPPTAPAAPKGSTVILPDLKGVAFVAGPGPLPKTPGAPGISVGGIAVLERPGFVDEIKPFLGKPLTFDQLNDITQRVIAFYRANDRPLVDVVVPEQDVSTGVVRILVTEFRVGAIKVEGNRWFTSDQVAAAFTLKPGDTIDANALLGELDVANANPFRHVDLVYQPGTQAGTTNLVLQTQDRLPLHVYAGYDNDGQRVLGRDRWTTGFTWGDAFWADQQLSYQLTTSDNFWHHRSAPPGEPDGPSNLAHSLSWSAPLPWGDRLSIFGLYEEEVPKVGASFGLTGVNGQASLRYTRPLPRTQSFTQAVEIGYDFKTTNNNLDFGGTAVSQNATEIDQFPLGYSANLTDPYGSTSLTTTLYWSPGGITAGNTDAAFQPGTGQSGRADARAEYLYFRGELDRLTRLPLDASWAVRFIGQVTDRNLLDTEQVSVGGADLLRGYDPNTINGDQGVVLSNELRTPSFPLLPDAVRPAGVSDDTQLLAFWDYAALSAKEEVEGSGVGAHASSVGLGLRYSLATNLTMKLDYGWQLQHLPGEPLGQFGFLSVTVGY
jgi:hemolysin activation/secretion protein